MKTWKRERRALAHKVTARTQWAAVGKGASTEPKQVLFLLLLLTTIIIILSTSAKIHPEHLHTTALLSPTLPKSLLFISTACQRNPKTAKRKIKTKQNTKTQVWETGRLTVQRSSITLWGSQRMLVSPSSSHSSQGEPGRKDHTHMKNTFPKLYRSPPSQSASLSTTHAVPDLEWGVTGYQVPFFKPTSHVKNWRLLLPIKKHKLI